ELGGGAPLAREAGDDVGLRSQRRQEDLERDVPLHAQVARLHHHAHPALSEEAHELVLARQDGPERRQALDDRRHAQSPPTPASLTPASSLLPPSSAPPSNGMQLPNMSHVPVPDMHRAPARIVAVHVIVMMSQDDITHSFIDMQGGKHPPEELLAVELVVVL